MALFRVLHELIDWAHFPLIPKPHILITAMPVQTDSQCDYATLGMTHTCHIYVCDQIC